MNKNIIVPLVILGAGIFFVMDVLFTKKVVNEIRDGFKGLKDPPTDTPPSQVEDTPPAPVESTAP